MNDRHSKEGTEQCGHPESYTRLELLEKHASRCPLLLEEARHIVGMQIGKIKYERFHLQAVLAVRLDHGYLQALLVDFVIHGLPVSAWDDVYVFALQSFSCKSSLFFSSSSLYCCRLFFSSIGAPSSTPPLWWRYWALLLSLRFYLLFNLLLSLL